MVACVWYVLVAGGRIDQDWRKGGFIYSLCYYDGRFY